MRTCNQQVARIERNGARVEKRAEQTVSYHDARHNKLTQCLAQQSQQLMKLNKNQIKICNERNS
jgi:hypothetical protein